MKPLFNILRLPFLAMALLCLLAVSSCNKNASGEGKKTEPANINYDVYIPFDEYGEIINEEINIIIEAKRLCETIEYRQSKGLDCTQAKRQLDALCGTNFNKQIHYGSADVLVVSKGAVWMGTVDVYSNYSGTKRIVDSGMSSDIVKAFVNPDKKRGIHYLQLVEKDMDSYNYTASGTKITVSNGSKWIYTPTKDFYHQEGSETEFTTCHFVD